MKLSTVPDPHEIIENAATLKIHDSGTISLIHHDIMQWTPVNLNIRVMIGSWPKQVDMCFRHLQRTNTTKIYFAGCGQDKSRRARWCATRLWNLLSAQPDLEVVDCRE